MRSSRRIFALFPLLAVSISGIAAQKQQTQPQALNAQQTSSPPVAEGPLASAARDLARKVAASLGADFRGKLAMDANPANLSSASAFDFQQGCAAFSAELASEGMTVPPANPQQAMTTVHLTLSSNFQGFLWVAEVTPGPAHKAFFSAVVPFSSSAAPPAAPQLTLQRQFLLSSPDPVLDAEILPSSPIGAPSLLVLQPESIARFTQVNGAWQLQSQAPIQHDRPWPRDLRGRLQQGPNGMQAVLPGMTCDIALQPSLSTSCKSADTPWVVSAGFNIDSTMLPQLSSQTNLFTFAPRPEYQFESLTVFEPGTATSPSGGFVPLVATLPDGRALLFEGSATPAASFSGWGSDISALWSRSRQRWPILATRDGELTQPDAIQAFDIVDRQAVPVSAPMDFDGPVTALWPEGEDEALAVSRNLKTGVYEAYLLHATYPQ
jgi:hypothetical protein